MSSSLPPDQTGHADYDDSIDVRELLIRLGRGAGQIIGFSALGLVVAVAVALVSIRQGDVTTGTRISFSFEGFERGEYPDKSKFQPEDLRSPDVILESLRRLGFQGSDVMQARVRSSINLEGIIPVEVTKLREKLRAAGQTPPPYLPDEYSLSLVLPRAFELALPDRERLISEIINVYREKFLRTYGTVPLNFGNAFESLKDADFPEYELILKQEIRSIEQYLIEQASANPTFRSPSTNRTFGDLLNQLRVFSQVRAYEALGTISLLGLTREKQTALLKLDYGVRELSERLAGATEGEKVVRDLLNQAQARGQGYVLGVKSQASQPRTDAPVLDQGLVDSLLANDSYNFLVRKALEAGLVVKALEVERMHLAERRRQLAESPASTAPAAAAGMERLTKALTVLEANYRSLVEEIRKTRDDSSRQKYADVVRVTDAIKTEGFLRMLAIYAAVGLVVGAALGVGTSMLEIYFPPRLRSKT